MTKCIHIEEKGSWLLYLLALYGDAMRKHQWWECSDDTDEEEEEEEEEEESEPITFIHRDSEDDVPHTSPPPR